MKLFTLLQDLGITEMITDYLDEPDFQAQLEKEVVVLTDRQLLPNASYDFEVETDGEDIEIHVRGRHAGRS